MKYFFLAYAIIAALFIGLMPTRGEKTPKTPLRLFPDMDDQDKLRAQKPSHFFADGAGGREPVAGTHPMGFLPDGASEMGGIPEYEFGGGTGYYYTGGQDGFYYTGMPEELGLDEENVTAFLRRGQEVFNVNCTPCHGVSGDGMGVVIQFGVPAAANLLSDPFKEDQYADGLMYEVITNGKGNMGAYKHNISVRDRWAVVAYVRALQTATKAPLSEPAVMEAYEKAKKVYKLEAPEENVSSEELPGGAGTPETAQPAADPVAPAGTPPAGGQQPVPESGTGSAESTPTEGTTPAVPEGETPEVQPELNNEEPATESQTDDGTTGEGSAEDNGDSDVSREPVEEPGSEEDETEQ